MSAKSNGALPGRGAPVNPPVRFERLVHEPDPEVAQEAPDGRLPATEVYRDATRSIIARNDSPDVGFAASINPYRGCEHGCIYCYARPTHEYLGLSAGLDFESKIFAKTGAADLLRAELDAPGWRPETLALSGVTDPYQPVERRLRITRACLEVLAERRHPVAVITKSQLVTRDIDLLGELARHRAAAVFVSVTTLEPELHRILEPRTASPARRLETIRALRAAGIPTGVLAAPVIPGLTDHELPSILEQAVAAGAQCAGYVLLRLPHAVKDLFSGWLETHFPERRDKVLGRIRSTRGGRLNDPRFGSRMRGEGIFAEQIEGLFKLTCRRLGLEGRSLDLSAAAFRRPGYRQLELFEEAR